MWLGFKGGLTDLLMTSEIGGSSRKRLRSGVLESGLDNLVTSTIDRDLKFINEFPGGREQLASFTASLLRDGELE